MENLVLTTLLFNATGIVVTSVGMALPYCLPRRRPRRAAAMVSVPTAPSTIPANSN